MLSIVVYEMSLRYSYFRDRTAENEIVSNFMWIVTESLDVHNSTYHQWRNTVNDPTAVQPYNNKLDDWPQRHYRGHAIPFILFYYRIV